MNAEQQALTTAHQSLSELESDYTKEAIDCAFNDVLHLAGVSPDWAEDFSRRLGNFAVILGDITSAPNGTRPKLWVPHTSGDAHTFLRRDGYLTDGETHEGLDVTSLGDKESLTVEKEVFAIEAWRKGEVLVSGAAGEDVPTLVIAKPRLTPSILATGLKRYFAQAA